MKILKDYSTMAVLAFLAVLFIVKFIGLFGFYPYGWDESVYLHTSEYIKSGGSAGLLENLRPLMFPVLLIPFSASVFFSRLLVLALGIATLWIFYLIGKQNIGSKKSWIFPVLIALFPIFFISLSSIMTEIPSLFFHAFAVYLFFRKKYLFAGLASFAAFFTRFSLGIYIPVLFLALLIIESRKQAVKYLLGVVIGFPLLLLNTFLYSAQASNPFLATIYPILNQLKDHAFSNYIWLYNKGFWFYFHYLFSWTPFVFFAIIGIIFLLKNLNIKKKLNDEDKNNIVIFFLFLVPFIYALISPHKEERYLMLVIPWIVYFISYGIIWLMEDMESRLFSAKPRIGKIVNIIMTALVLLSVFLGISGLVFQNPDPVKGFYDNYLFELEDLDSNNKILTAIPMIKTKAKIIPGYRSDNFFYEKLTGEVYDYVYYTSSSFPCRDEDQICLNLRRETKQYLDKNYHLHKEYFFQGSDFFIYKY